MHRKTQRLHAVGRSRLARNTAERIFNERREGRTLTAIAEGLNRDCVPTGKGGKRWYPSSVAAVLSRNRAESDSKDGIEELIHG
ncbi:MAG: recombinase family protein [Dehalococcoidia bacterium]|nr:recombinase family protein [Dehalococcoidia bacterium]